MLEARTSPIVSLMNDSIFRSTDQRLTISVVSYSEPFWQLEMTLRSVAVATRELHSSGMLFRARIVVVDNREKNGLSQEDIQAIMKDVNPDTEISIIQGHGNIGYGAAQNLTLDQNPNGFHLFLNPDLKVAPDSILVGLDFLLQNPDVGIVAPFATDFNNKKLYLNKRYPTVFDLFLRGIYGEYRTFKSSRLFFYEMQDLCETEPTTKLELISGCFMLCRNRFLLDIGGFDQSYFLYFEDFDLSIRMRSIAKLAYEPKMRIKHWGGNAARKGASHLLIFILSGIRFYNRHGWRWYKQDKGEPVPK